MPSHRRFNAPTSNGEVRVFPDFGDVPDLVEENRRKLDRTDVVIGGLPLRELRALARREAGVETDGPLLLAGHQPELAHPGVWVKNFALTGLAKKHRGIGLNLIVDNDTLKNTSLRFPVFQDRDPASVHLESVAFDRFENEVPFEDRTVLDTELFRTFTDRAAQLWASWGYEPLLEAVWKRVSDGNIGEIFTTLRCEREQEWACNNLEVPVSWLSRTEAFAAFAWHILADLPRFRDVYNAAIRAYRKANHIRSDNHPAPELAEGEAPFWVRNGKDGRRTRATPASHVRCLRPRALTLTLFARVCLGDFFIHGIGGGKYDEVTDAIIRDYFRIDPPAYQVLSATLHLPLPGFPAMAGNVKCAVQQVRDLHWNPQRHLAFRDVTELLNRKEALIACEPPRDEHAERRRWFRDLREVTEQLRPFVAAEMSVAEDDLERVRAEAAANEVLTRRDYSWVLYPEETLRPFLQRFLEL